MAWFSTVSHFGFFDSSTAELQFCYWGFVRLGLQFVYVFRTRKIWTTLRACWNAAQILYQDHYIAFTNYKCLSDPLYFCNVPNNEVYRQLIFKKCSSFWCDGMLVEFYGKISLVLTTSHVPYASHISACKISRRRSCKKHPSFLYHGFLGECQAKDLVWIKELPWAILDHILRFFISAF